VVILARAFNGTTDRIDWANVANLAGSAITISLWMWIDSFPNSYPRVITFNQSGDADRSAVLVLYNDGTYNAAIGWQRVTTSTSMRRASVNTTLATGAWAHYIVTDTGVSLSHTAINIYINGVVVAYNAALDLDGAGTEKAWQGKWSLGGYSYTDLYNFDGNIAEVGVWNRVLAASEIADLAAGMSPRAIESGLLWHPPLFGDTVETDWVTGAAGTLDGTAKADHPPIWYPNYYAQRAAVGGSILFPPSLLQRQPVGVFE
jgi:hypothetical protein